MRQWIRSALVQMMACRLIDANPLSEPILGWIGCMYPIPTDTWCGDGVFFTSGQRRNIVSDVEVASLLCRVLVHICPRRNWTLIIVITMVYFLHQQGLWSHQHVAHRIQILRWAQPIGAWVKRMTLCVQCCWNVMLFVTITSRHDSGNDMTGRYLNKLWHTLAPS